jgi:hypothetical protein
MKPTLGFGGHQTHSAVHEKQSASDSASAAHPPTASALAGHLRFLPCRLSSAFPPSPRASTAVDQQPPPSAPGSPFSRSSSHSQPLTGSTAVTVLSSTPHDPLPPRREGASSVRHLNGPRAGEDGAGWLETQAIEGSRRRPCVY